MPQDWSAAAKWTELAVGVDEGTHGWESGGTGNGVLRQ